MRLPRRTNEWATWWRDRKIDWKTSYLDSWNHPHRKLLCASLTQFPWLSLFEVGLGAGANLVTILKHFPGRQLGGMDVSEDAIALARKTFNGALLKVGSVEDIMLSDNSVDVILSDMCLIYIDPSKIGKVLTEIKRVARNNVVFCEFHHKSWWRRLKLRLTSGYYAYDYQKTLAKYGYYDIMVTKIPPEFWPGGQPQLTFGYIITAKVPSRK